MYPDKFNFTVVDIESTARGPELDKLNPRVTKNIPVLIGYREGAFVNEKELVSKNVTIVLEPVGPHTMEIYNAVQPPALDGNSALVLIGHNIKFDLSYLEGHKYINLRHGRLLVWDTSVYQYLTSGMRHIFPSLEDTCAEWGVHYTKDANITKQFQDGVDTEYIDREDLRRYCAEDIDATYHLFIKQWDDYVTRPKNFQTLVYEMMMFVKPLTEMENHGLNFNMEGVHEAYIKASNDMQHAYANILSYSNVALGVDCVKHDINVTSNKTISTILYAVEPITITERVNDGFYKNGKLKTKNVTRKILPTPVFAKPDGEHGKLGPPVDDAALNNCLAIIESNGAEYFVNVEGYILSIKQYRESSKIVNTYLKNVIEWCLETGETSIYPYYQNTATGTGRLSSSKPNAQNFPALVKNLIVPNHIDSTFITVDFKQLELCGLAQKSREPTLISDIKAGVDVHDRIGWDVYGRQPTPDERRPVKGVVFGTIYGGGVNTLHEQSGIPKKLIRSIQAAWFKRYSGLKPYYDNLVRSLITPKHTRQVDGKIYFEYIDNETGRIYTIPQDERSRLPSYTQVRNRPIQGWATGDLVPFFINRLYEQLHTTHKQNIGLVTTEHDSLTLEIRNVLTSHTQLLLNFTVDEIPMQYERMFGAKLLVPIVGVVKVKETL